MEQLIFKINFQKTSKYKYKKATNFKQNSTKDILKGSVSKFQIQHQLIDQNNWIFMLTFNIKSFIKFSFTHKKL